MCSLPALRHIRENFVVGAAKNDRVTEAVVRYPAATDGQVAHLTVEHGEGSRRMFDEQLQYFFAFALRLLSLLALADVNDRADITEELALRTVARRGPINHPAILTVFAPQTV